MYGHKAVPHCRRATDKPRNFKRDNAFFEFVVGGFCDVNRGKVRKFVPRKFSVNDVRIAVGNGGERRKVARANKRDTVYRTAVAFDNDVIRTAFVRSFYFRKLF